MSSFFENLTLQVVEQTPFILKLQAKGDSLCFILLSRIPFVLIGLLLIIIFGNSSTLKCNRLKSIQVTCELTTSSLLREHTTLIPTGQLQGAKVEVTTGGKSNKYQLVILTKNSNIPLGNNTNLRAREKRGKAYQINSFIHDKEKTIIKIREDDHWYFYPFGGWFILGGISSILQALILKLEISCIFDKGLGRMYLKRQYVFKQDEVREEMLHKIKKVLVVEETSKKGNKFHSIQLMLGSGEKITLLNSNVSYNNEKVALSINQFLGLTEQDIREVE
jgi:hypothetical protein